jgi:hypothetical protein
MLSHYTFTVVNSKRLSPFVFAVYFLDFFAEMQFFLMLVKLTSGEDKEIDKLGMRVRHSTRCAVVIAEIDVSEKNPAKTLERIGFVSEKMKKGILVLFRFGVPAPDQLASTFTRKTIIVTGKVMQLE